MVAKRELSPLSEDSRKVRKCVPDGNYFEVNLNPLYSSDRLIDEVKSVWDGNGQANSDLPIECLSEPFKCVQLKHMIQNETFLADLRRELLDMPLIEKNNDLYKFRQTDSLVKVGTSCIKQLRDLLSGQILDLARRITGIQLSDQIDLGSSQYQYTDTLLCHDDELEGRRVAFVLYLTPDWDPTHGGLLQLFNTDECGRPDQVVRSLVPEFNSITMFPVSPVSFHQVSEVIGRDRTRLSVNGWFHGPPLERAAVVPPVLPYRSPGQISEGVLYKWINPLYLADETLRSIRQQFEEESEIQLPDFLLPDAYSRLQHALTDGSSWREVGPADRQRVELVEREVCAEVVTQCVDLFSSEALMLILAQMTGLSLHPLSSLSEKESEARLSDPELPGSSGVVEDTTTSSDANHDSNQEIICSGEKDPDSVVSRVNHRESDRGSERESETGSDSGNDPEYSGKDLDATGDNRNHCGSSDSIGRCHCELRRWRRGCYTLVNDMCAAQMALESRLFVGCDVWSDDWGGVTSYIARGEEEELLSVSPQSNTLCLVYKDRDTLSFTKYLNHASSDQPPYYEIFSTYQEPNDDPTNVSN